MRIAWFRDTTPDRSDPLDDTASLIEELRSVHSIDVILEAGAHDFVWQSVLRPWDLCVYELENTRAHHFLWAYLLNYPGVVMLRSPFVQNSWGGVLSREGRLDDYMAGFRLDEGMKAPPVLQVPLFASRSVVVSYGPLASSLQATYPAARVRFAPTGVRAIERDASALRSGDALVVGTPGGRRVEPVRRAVERARAAGDTIELLTGVKTERLVRESDVIIALTWPPFEAPLTAALAGMAAAKPVVTLELEATAEWPALDPQTWRPRGVVATAPPIAVTVDPRDEVHSLMLAMRRLAADAALRDSLGDAAHAWWQSHATPAHAGRAWNRILEEAASVTPPPRPADWPKHLDADGTELTRAILAEFGAATDLWPTAPTRNPARS